MQERRWERKLHGGKGDGSRLKRRLEQNDICNVDIMIQLAFYDMVEKMKDLSRIALKSTCLVKKSLLKQ
jgi:hypothetical protein